MNSHGWQSEGQARVWALVRAAQRLRDSSSPWGKRVRAGLLESSGLSAEGVELALCEHLETSPSDDEVSALVASVAPVPRVHVSLAGNVFTAAHRALALAVAASEHVVVRTSRRDPAFARALVDAVAPPRAAGAITFVSDLTPAPGEELHAYGSDETLLALVSKLPPKVLVRLHGHGMGVGHVGRGQDWVLAARMLARDMVPFDQRGCLSPRVVLVHATESQAKHFGELLLDELERWAQRVPVGTIGVEERAAQSRFETTLAAVGEVMGRAGSVVGVSQGLRLVVPAPVGRCMHVMAYHDAEQAVALVQGVARYVAAVGTTNEQDDPVVSALRAAVPTARWSALGDMQRPRFDGPVDCRRPGRWTAEQVLGECQL